MKAFFLITGAIFMAAGFILLRLKSNKLPPEADIIQKSWESISDNNSYKSNIR